MKKLQKLVLHKTTPLTIPQMKHITGGYNGSGEYGGGGTCGWAAWTGDSWVGGCDVSQSAAYEMFKHWDTPHKYWCCDHCSGTFYCGDGSGGGEIYG